MYLEKTVTNCWSVIVLQKELMSKTYFSLHQESRSLYEKMINLITEHQGRQVMEWTN